MNLKPPFVNENIIDALPMFYLFVLFMRIKLHRRLGSSISYLAKGILWLCRVGMLTSRFKIKIGRIRSTSPY